MSGRAKSAAALLVRAGSAVIERLEARSLLAANITGTLYNDRNSNGVQDGGEPGLPGWTVYLDQNQNRIREGGEQFTVTDGVGNYTFAGLINGTYYVTPETPAGWQQIAPLVPTAHWDPAGPAAIINGQVEGMPVQQFPVAGAIKAIAAHPTDPATIYVGTVNGGVWKTTNGNSAAPLWTALTDQYASLSIGALKFDPTDGTNQTLVAGIGRFSSEGGDGGSRAGLLRTTDGGASWTLLTSIMVGKNISGVAPRGNIIVASVDIADNFIYPNIGIFRSVNGGTTFVKISGPNGSTFTNGLPGGRAYDLAGDPTNPAILYCAIRDAGPNNGIYKSINTGATWARVSDAPMQGFNTDAGVNSTANIKIAVGNANNVYVGFINGNGQLSALFRSGDGGLTWTPLDVPISNENGFAVGLQPEDAPRDIPIPGLKKEPREKDKKLSKKKGGVDEAAREEEAGGQGAIHFSMAADPFDPNIVYLGGDRQPSQLNGLGQETGFFPNSIGANNYSGRIFRVNALFPPGTQAIALTNNPTTPNNSSPHADSRGMAFDPGGGLMECDDGGIYRRTNPTGFGDWSGMTGNLQNTEFISLDYDQNSNRISGGTQDVGRIESLPVGNTWNTFSQGDGGFTQIDDSTFGSSIRYSTYTFLDDFRRDTLDSLGNITFSSPVLKMVNGSGGMDIGHYDPNVQFYTPYVLNHVMPSRMAIGTADAYTSFDGGDNLDDLGYLSGYVTSLDYGGRQNGIDNPDVLYVGCGSAGGGTLGLWVQTVFGGGLVKKVAYPGGSVRAVMMDPNNWMRAFVADDSNVYMTTDAGNSWSTITGALVNGTLRSLAVIPGANALLVGGGLGVFMTSLASPGTSWKPVGDLPNVPVIDLRYDSTDDTLIAGTLGRGAWKISGVLPSLTTQISEQTISLAGSNVAGVSFGSFPYIFNGSAGPDSYTIIMLGGGAVEQVSEGLNGGLAVQYTIDVSIRPINFFFNSGAGSDSLVVDYSGSSPVPPAGLYFDGGADFDSMTVYGTGGPDNITIDNAFTGPTGGNININSVLNGAVTVESISMFGATGADTFNLQGDVSSALTYGGGNTPAEHDTLNITQGNYSFPTDSGLITSNFDFNVYGPGTAVTFNATQHLASLLLNAATATLAVNGSRFIKTSALSIVGAGARLDLKDNDLIVKGGTVGTWTGSAYTGLTGLLRSGRNGGGWGGNGIVTSQTQATSGNFTTLGIATFQQSRGLANPTDTVTYGGETVTGSDVLVKYTYGGDANLDGKINVDDYGHIDTSIGIHLTGWFNGDFNYDGKINVDDYGIIDFNIGIQGPPL